MHPLRTPLEITESADGSLAVSGILPPLDSWETGETAPRRAGCYALFRKHQLVYIGESDNMQERLRSHQVSFDEARWLALDGAQRLLVEKVLIWFYMPEDNKEMKRHDYRMMIKKEVQHASV